MKAHTQEFKNNIKRLGRQLDSKITYTINNEEIELGKAELNSITPHYEGDILKSVMKQLDIDSNIDIPVGTELNYQFGVLVNGSYEYIDFGNYIVKESERQEDTRSYLIKCYDKMLYAMKDYEDMSITYPITIRNYINTICTHLGLTFQNVNDEFVNYNKEIQKELYLDTEGNSIGYTFRNVLDELAQATASTIVINDDDKLEIRYITDTQDTIDGEYLKDINVNFGESYGSVNTIVLSRSAGADKISLSTENVVLDSDKVAIEISDNQIMNFDDRSDYMPEILNKLAGLQYYLNDFSSTGICYYDICDMYYITIDNNTYNCIMFNDEINITQGLEEIVHTEAPDTSEQEYKYMDSTDQKINATTLTVDKQNQIIEGLVSQQTETSQLLSRTIQTVENMKNIFQITGGSNMIKNSQFLLTDKTWLFTNNGTNPYHTALGSGYDSQLAGQTVASAKIELRNVILESGTADVVENNTITQIKNIDNLIIGQTYTLSYEYIQDEDTTTYVRLYDGNGTLIRYFYMQDGVQKQDDLEITYNSQKTNRESQSFQFIATTKDCKLEIETSTTRNETNRGYFTIYDLMLNSGDKKPWEPAQSEISSTILTMSMQGMQINSMGSNTTALLNAQGINIYAGQDISGTPVTSFDEEGLITGVAKTNEVRIGKYILDEIDINNTTHHIEYFGGE